jgi:hypothetical protein
VGVGEEREHGRVLNRRQPPGRGCGNSHTRSREHPRRSVIC